MAEKPLPEDGALQIRPCGLRGKGRNGRQTLPQNSVLCIQPCGLTTPTQVNFPLEKKWEGRSLWWQVECAGIAWGLQPRGVSSDPCLLLVTVALCVCVCLCVCSPCSFSLLPPASCCPQVLVLLFQRGGWWRIGAVEHRRKVAQVPLVDVPEATSSGAQIETKLACALHHPIFPTRTEEKGNRASV